MSGKGSKMKLVLGLLPFLLGLGIVLYPQLRGAAVGYQIDRMLSYEKYAGQVLMQKTYTPDFLSGKQKKNNGELAMYLMENAHEAIIDREMFEKVQEKKRTTHNRKNSK